MTIHALWVINKAGGLVFSRSYSGAFKHYSEKRSQTLLAVRATFTSGRDSGLSGLPLVPAHRSSGAALTLKIWAEGRYPAPLTTQHNLDLSGNPARYPRHHLASRPILQRREIRWNRGIRSGVMGRTSLPHSYRWVPPIVTSPRLDDWTALLASALERPTKGKS